MPATVKTIGRVGAADFCLDVPLVSRLHCRVEVDPEGDVEIVDLDSTNGTWIDGGRITRARLRPGSILRVGRVEFGLEPAS
jgi:pSer/pThr/pTyr-binding forkhead associated (FHA) protein